MYHHIPDGLERDYARNYQEFLNDNHAIVNALRCAFYDLMTQLEAMDYHLAHEALQRLDDACFLMSGAIETLRPLTDHDERIV